MPHFARYPSLQERHVLITGGATGIGATLVEQFIAQGARVGFIDIDGAAGEALAARLPGAFFVRADLTDIEALRAAIASLRDQLGGPFQVLLNNAANDRRIPVEDVTSESWDAGLAVNLITSSSPRRRCCPTCAQRAAGPSSISVRSAGCSSRAACRLTPRPRRRFRA